MAIEKSTLTFAPEEFRSSFVNIAEKEESVSRDDWLLVNHGYNPSTQDLMEVVNNVGNTLMRFRDAVDGSSTQIHNPDAYIEGLYEQPPQSKPEGQEASTIPEGVNIPSFLPLTIFNGREELDMDTANIANYSTTLDIQKAKLTRSFIWYDSSEGEPRATKIVEERIASYTDKHTYAAKYSVTPLNYTDKISLLTGINANVDNNDKASKIKNERKDFFKGGVTTKPVENGILLKARTQHSGREVAIAQRTTLSVKGEQKLTAEMQVGQGDRVICQNYMIDAKEGETYILEKIVNAHASTDPIVEPGKSGDPEKLAKEAIKNIGTYAELLEAHEKAWENIWNKIDVEIVGDPQMQRALRFCKLQLYMSLNPDMINGIGAKEAYKVGGRYDNHDFWDTPINMLPIFDAYPEIAESYLKYQYKLLGAAREKARQNGYEGAWFGWEGTVPPPEGPEDGEATPKFLENSVGKIVEVFSWKGEIHRSFDTAYAVMRNYKITDNREFMDNYGTEIVLDAAKFYTSRAQIPEDAKPGDPIERYEYRDVEGPNEYHEHINNNGFTNITAKWTMMKALELIDNKMVSDDLRHKLGLTDEKISHMRDVCAKVYIPFDPHSLLIDQFDGYEDLRYVDPQPYIERKASTGEQIDEAMLKDWKKAEKQLEEDILAGRTPDLAPFAILPEKVAKTRIGKQPDRTLAIDLLYTDFLEVITPEQRAILELSGQSPREILRRIKYANVYADKAGRFPGILYP